jgi:hypothetical protein
LTHLCLDAHDQKEIGGAMRMIAILIAALPLFSQKAKPPTHAVAWSYETPRGFQLLEPAYRFPTQIKQALVQFVQPVPALSKEYQSVFLDKRKFSAWFKGVLIDYKTKRTRLAKSEGSVLSSDPSKMTSDGGTVLSTARIRPKQPTDLAAIERYLDVLKAWDPE